MARAFIIKSLQDFQAVRLSVESRIAEDAKNHDAWNDTQALKWADSPNQWNRQEFIAPSYDWNTAEAMIAKLFGSPNKWYREHALKAVNDALTTIPNDAHMGDILIAV